MLAKGKHRQCEQRPLSSSWRVAKVGRWELGKASKRKWSINLKSEEWIEASQAKLRAQEFKAWNPPPSASWGELSLGPQNTLLSMPLGAQEPITCNRKFWGNGKIQWLAQNKISWAFLIPYQGFAPFFALLCPWTLALTPPCPLLAHRCLLRKSGHCWLLA